MELWLSVILFIIGLIILIKGSDFFIDSAVFMAKRYGVSKLIIGLTLVSVGTSLPEFAASVYASYTGEGEIAVGNVVGSNIANIALVLGFCLVLREIQVNRKMVGRDGVIMLGVSLLFTFFLISGVARWEGLILMACFGFYLLLLRKQNKEDKKERHIEPIETQEKSLAKEVTKLVIGCFGVIVGAMFMVESAVELARTFGISETVIGSTIVAFGTSVPELAVSLTAILKKYEEISIGNIIGSNIFNILWVMGAAALVSDLAVDNAIFYPNVLIMLIVAALLFAFMVVGRTLKRWQGAVFAAIYVVFLVMNFS